MPLFLFLKGLKKAGYMHYYKFNIADYRKDTGHLSTVEHSIYRQLIDWYYLDEKPIPLETQVVMRRLSLGSEHEPALQNVLSDFFVQAKNGYTQNRIDMEINDYHGQSAKNKTNGMLGGRPKKTQSVILANPDESQINPNHKPVTNNHKPVTKVKSATAVACPPDVSPEVWSDWLQLRKTKKASVTNTVINGARLEAEKIGWTLEQFLVEWCTRGSQGLKAEWIQEKQKPSFAQQASDAVRSTVPYSQDKALRKVEEDHKTGAPPPAHIREMMRGILGVKNA